MKPSRFNWTPETQAGVAAYFADGRILEPGWYTRTIMRITEAERRDIIERRYYDRMAADALGRIPGGDPWPDPPVVLISRDRTRKRRRGSEWAVDIRAPLAADWQTDRRL